RRVGGRTASALIMRIAIACDHRGFAYKAPMIRALEAEGHTVTDLGTNSDAPSDYPDFAYAVGTAVRDGRADIGVLICGSGAGVAIAANKLRGVRAAVCHDLFTARQSRGDDDANVICLGARVVDVAVAIPLTTEFVHAKFSSAERHHRRLEKVLAPERAERPPAARAHADPRLLEIGDHDRGLHPLPVLSRRDGAGDAARRCALRRDHRSGYAAREARERGRIPPDVPERPADRRALLGALVLR